MKYFIAAILTLSLTFPAIAQLEKSDIRLVREAEFTARNYQGEVEGSPFLNNEWQTGLVFLKSGKTSNMVKLRYNILQNQLLLQRNGRAYSVMPNRMTGFVFVDEGHRTKFGKGFRSAEHNINRNQLLRMIYDGSIKLVARYESNKNERRDAFSGAVTIRFINDQVYYLITSDGSFHEVDLDKEDILKALNDEQQALQKFARQNDLNWDEETDLKQILAHYDGLVAQNG